MRRPDRAAVPCKPEDLGFRKRAAAGITAPGHQELCLFYKTTAGFTLKIRSHQPSSSITKKPISTGYSNSFIEKDLIEFSMFVIFRPTGLTYSVYFTPGNVAKRDGLRFQSPLKTRIKSKTSHQSDENLKNVYNLFL
jgi:hypothetical protein